MPEDIEKILELAKPATPQPPAEPPPSKSARFSRWCGFLALASVVFFWLVIGLSWLAEKAGGNIEGLLEFLLVSECCLLPCLSIAAVITATVGLVGAKRYSGNRKVALWAIALTVLAVAGFTVPIYAILSRMTIHFW